jgi:valyl-tRNA synthetase
MSKSDPETIIDPMEVIPEYGTDALRLALLQGMSAGNDQRLGRSKIVANRNFANKLWNVARYIESVIGDEGRADPRPDSIADHWILSKLQRYQADIQADLENFRFNLAYERLYHFVWDDLADWYVEASKAAPNKPMLAYILEQVLLLAHPFAPFLTETIWQTLDWEHGSVLAKRTLSGPLKSDRERAREFEDLKAIVSEARYYIQATKSRDVSLYHDDVAFYGTNSGVIRQLSGLKAIKVGNNKGGLHLTSAQYPAELDIDASKTAAYAKELSGRLQTQQELIQQLEKRLANRDYVKNAPDQVVDQTRQQLSETKELAETLREETQRFNK